MGVASQLHNQWCQGFQASALNGPTQHSHTPLFVRPPPLTGKRPADDFLMSPTAKRATPAGPSAAFGRLDSLGSLGSLPRTLSGGGGSALFAAPMAPSLQQQPSVEQMLRQLQYVATHFIFSSVLFPLVFCLLCTSGHSCNLWYLLASSLYCSFVPVC